MLDLLVVERELCSIPSRSEIRHRFTHPRLRITEGIIGYRRMGMLAAHRKIVPMGPSSRIILD